MGGRDQVSAGAKATDTGKAPYSLTVSPDAEAGMPYTRPVKEVVAKRTVSFPEGINFNLNIRDHLS